MTCFLDRYIWWNVSGTPYWPCTGHKCSRHHAQGANVDQVPNHARDTIIQQIMWTRHQAADTNGSCVSFLANNPRKEMWIVDSPMSPDKKNLFEIPSVPLESPRALELFQKWGNKVNSLVNRQTPSQLLLAYPRQDHSLLPETEGLHGRSGHQ